MQLLPDFKFKAVYQDDIVYMDWEKYSLSESLKYYKVVRSIKNSNPVYPEDGHIKYSKDINFTEYTDKWPPYGDVYYRVCAITKEKNRYCSKVVKVDIKKPEKNTQKVCTREYVPVCGEYKHECCSTNNNPKCKIVKVSCTPKLKTYSNKCVMENAGAVYKYSGKCEEKESPKSTSYQVSTKIKKRAQILINNFINKLEKKGLTDSEIIKKIDTITQRLEKLKKKKPKVSKIIDYIIFLLEEKRGKYEDDFGEIENIFSEE